MGYTQNSIGHDSIGHDEQTDFGVGDSAKLNPSLIWIVFPENFDSDTERAPGKKEKAFALIDVLDEARTKSIPVAMTYKPISKDLHWGIVKHIIEQYSPICKAEEIIDALKKIKKGVILIGGAHLCNTYLDSEDIACLSQGQYAVGSSKDRFPREVHDKQGRILYPIASGISVPCRRVLECNKTYSTELEAIIDTRITLPFCDSIGRMHEASFYKAEQLLSAGILASLSDAYDVF